MYTTSKNKNQFNKKTALIIGVILAAVIISGSVFVMRRSPANTSQSPAPTTAPATEEERQETEDRKDQMASDYDNKPTPTPTPSDNSNTPPGQKATTTITITYAGQYAADDSLEVGSYVNNIFEDGGICTLTMTKGSRTVTKEVTGVRDVSKTLCPVFTVAKAELGETGTWTYVVSYESTTTTAKAPAAEVEIR